MHVITCMEMHNVHRGSKDVKGKKRQLVYRKKSYDQLLSSTQYMYVFLMQYLLSRVVLFGATFQYSSLNTLRADSQLSNAIEHDTT